MLLEIDLVPGTFEELIGVVKKCTGLTVPTGYHQMKGS